MERLSWQPRKNKKEEFFVWQKLLRNQKKWMYSNKELKKKNLIKFISTQTFPFLYKSSFCEWSQPSFEIAPWWSRKVLSHELFIFFQPWRRRTLRKKLFCLKLLKINGFKVNHLHTINTVGLFLCCVLMKE